MSILKLTSSEVISLSVDLFLSE